MADDLPTHEYRITCSGSGHQHRLHIYPKRTLDKARQAVIDSTHHAEMHPLTFYAACTPWQIETRLVSKWNALEED